MAEKTAPETTDRLRHDIDSGQTGDKTDWSDPAAAPLGTDDEASGNPPTPSELAMEEKSTPVKTPLHSSIGAGALYIGIAVVLLAVIAVIVINSMG